MKTALTMLSVLCVLLVGVGSAVAASLQWDRNTEGDMKDYGVYACFTGGCVVVKSAAMLQAFVPQPAVGVVPSWPIPSTITAGAVAVSARDLSLNESGLSVSANLDVLAPSIPVNPRVQ